MFDFRMKTFLVLCKNRSYTKTAEELFITQPAVSSHIRFLEKHFNTKLFIYASKTLSLTPAGEELLRHAKTIQNDSKHLQDKLKSLKQGRVHLAFAAPPFAVRYVLPPAVKNLFYNHQFVDITLMTRSSSEILSIINENKIHAAIITGFFDKSIYTHHFLGKEEFVGICSPDFHLRKPSVSFDDLLEERLILGEEGSDSRSIFEEELGRNGFSTDNFRSINTCSESKIIKDLIMDGVGIGFLSERVVRKELLDGTLCRLNIGGLRFWRDLNFIYVKNSMYEPQYVDLFEFIRSYYN